jgi:hypothetical protein
MGWLFLGLILASVISLISWNLRRSQEKVEFTLRPNCLLTKHPIVFIEGRKSIFYFLSYWNQIPQFLFQHGYEVLEYELHWRDSKKRLQQLRDFLEEADLHNLETPPAEHKKFHLIIDRASFAEAKSLFSKYSFSSVASCALISNKTPFFISALKHPIEDILVKKRNSPFLLRLSWLIHQLWTQSLESDVISIGINIGTSEIQKNEICNLRNQILDRAILLAERDFAMNSTLNLQQGKTANDENSNGNSRNPGRLKDLSTPSC